MKKEWTEWIKNDNFKKAYKRMSITFSRTHLLDLHKPLGFALMRFWQMDAPDQENSTLIQTGVDQDQEIKMCIP